MQRGDVFLNCIFSAAKLVIGELLTHELLAKEGVQITVKNTNTASKAEFSRCTFTSIEKTQSSRVID